MKRSALASLVVLVGSFLLLFTSLAMGQEVAGLTGTVTDKTGAVVPDATVKLVDTRTNSSFESKTSSLGAYNFVKLNPGPGYKLTVSKDGFETLTVADIYLAVGGTHTKDVQLEVGRVTDVVEVSGAGAAVALNTTDATIGNYFDMRSVQELPVQVRDNPTALLGLQPGVIGAG